MFAIFAQIKNAARQIERKHYIAALAFAAVAIHYIIPEAEAWAIALAGATAVEFA